MPRRAPAILLVVGFTVLLGWYAIYTQRVIAELRREASRSGLMSARVFRALSDPSEGASTAALLDLAQHIREIGVPVIVTDPHGVPRDTANLPFAARLDSPDMRDYVRELDAQNPPVIEPAVGIVHFGNTPLVRGLRVIPVLQGILLAFLIAFGVFTLRTRAHVDREKVWAGMARESAHQLGTPLSSLSGWLELLRERAPGGPAAAVLDHMQSDLDRLDRVAHRFERIGRPSRAQPVEAGELVERVAAYFRARVPSLAHTVTITTQRAEGDLQVEGDAVLLEWAVEALTKNAIDALAGRGGHVTLSAEPVPEGGVRLRVADDGPGVARELRKDVFRPGFSTKARGWGIGLSLARRIVEDNHGGRLLLVPADRGATFDIILP
ncbi:MAG: sensor histidine kinase [Gemmatimonadales bacterium]|jgi:signal transduction histidine kinase